MIRETVKQRAASAGLEAWRPIGGFVLNDTSAGGGRGVGGGCEGLGGFKAYTYNVMMKTMPG